MGVRNDEVPIMRSVTDRQIEAVLKAYSDDVMSDTNPDHIYRDKHKSGMRAALEAYEKLREQDAWCFDMDKAPRDRTEVDLIVNGKRLTNCWYDPVLREWCYIRCGYFDSLGEATKGGKIQAWRHLPSLPTQEGTR